MQAQLLQPSLAGENYFWLNAIHMQQKVYYHTAPLMIRTFPDYLEQGVFFF